VPEVGVLVVVLEVVVHDTTVAHPHHRPTGWGAGGTAVVFSMHTLWEQDNDEVGDLVGLAGGRRGGCAVVDVECKTEGIGDPLSISCTISSANLVLHRRFCGFSSGKVKEVRT
jgi:hypothetical protein